MNDFTFTPDRPEVQVTIPYFEQARSNDGWQGQASHKGIDQMRDEMVTALNKLGASITKLQTGTFTIEHRQRAGVILEFTMGGAPGRISLAALPVRSGQNRIASIKMLYYITRNVFNGLWLLQQLAPGMAALLPFLLVNGNQTLSEVWAERTTLGLLLPPGDAEFVEGEVIR